MPDPEINLTAELDEAEAIVTGGKRVHAESRLRQKLVGVRMSPAEHELLAAEAKRTGRSEASVLRDSFLAALPAEAPGDRTLGGRMPRPSGRGEVNTEPVSPGTDLAARLNANPGYQSALRDAGSESWDGPGIDGSAMIEAANERRRGRGGAGVAAETLAEAELLALEMRREAAERARDQERGEEKRG